MTGLIESDDPVRIAVREGPVIEIEGTDPLLKPGQEAALLCATVPLTRDQPVSSFKLRLLQVLNVF